MTEQLPRQDVVSRLRERVAAQIGQERFDLWFGESLWKYDNGQLVIGDCDARRLSRLKSKMHLELMAACEELLGASPVLSYERQAAPASPTLNGRPTPAASEDTIVARVTNDRRIPRDKSVRTPASGSPRSTPRTVSGRVLKGLDTFIVGPCNQVAAASARMVADCPGRNSPFVIYGPPGSGKSHLLEGLASFLRAKQISRPGGNRRCLCQTAEQFTTDFTEAIQGRGTPSFRQRYRHVDLLVIEDLQFFANKRATLIEFQYTIDAVIRQGGQLAFSADRSPLELSHLGDEIVHRLCGGLVAKLEPLDCDTRHRVLNQIAADRSLSLDDAVLDLLADHLVGDARYLMGAVIRLQAYADAWKRPIDLDLAKEALGDLLAVAPSRVCRLDDIELAVCELFGLDPRKLRSDNRTQRVSQPRMLAMWLARKHTSSALSEIGEHFGRRSHSTVISAEKKVNSLLACGSSIRMNDGTCAVTEAVRRIENQLRLA